MKTKLIIALSLFTLICAGNLYSQKADSTKRLFCSFGIRANTFLLSDYVIQNIPPARLHINCDPIKNLRLEVQYGYNKTTRDLTSGTNPKFTLTTKTSIFSAGIFGLIKRDRTNFYLGMRYGIVNYSIGDYDGITNSVNTGVMTMFSGVLGGEYLLGRRFSIGGEFSMVSLKDVYTPYNATTNPERTNTNLLSETSIILRFYPF